MNHGYVDTEEAVRILIKELSGVAELMSSEDRVSIKVSLAKLIGEMTKASRPYPWGSNNLGEEK